MDVMIVATRQCGHYPSLSKELEALNVPHQVVFVEDDPELAQKLNIRHSPNVVVDGEVVFRGQPSEAELRERLKSRS